jgi:DNA-directed RNA polymerase subunit F
MTIKEAREILADDALGLTDDEVQEIIDWLDKMADIAIESVEKESIQ